MLIVNALMVAALSGSYCLFRVTTPHWILLLTLLTGGFFRSLQFTALNAMGYADIPQPLMSRASSLASMFQQLAQSLGVGLGGHADPLHPGVPPQPPSFRQRTSARPSPSSRASP